MIPGLLILLVCQLIGEFVVRVLSVPVPGPVVGMVLLFIALRVRHPGAKSDVVLAADGLLNHLPLLFIPAGVGVISYLPLLAHSWVAIVGGLVVAWLATLSATAGAGAATVWLQSRVRSATPAAGGGGR